MVVQTPDRHLICLKESPPDKAPDDTVCRSRHVYKLLACYLDSLLGSGVAFKRIIMGEIEIGIERHHLLLRTAQHVQRCMQSCLSAVVFSETYVCLRLRTITLLLLHARWEGGPEDITNGTKIIL